MYLDVYVHVHLVTPSIWMVFHFWGLKRMTSKLAGCNRKEPKIPKEKCNAVVRFKDWHAKTLTQIKRKFQRKFMIHESHDDIKSYQVASSHMLDTLFSRWGSKKSAERTTIGPLRRDVAGKDARSWDEVWDSEAPRPGIQCQTHTARCHCKYVKKYHIKSQKIAYVYDVKFLPKTYPKQNIRIIHFQHTTWYPILYPYYIPMICSLYLIIPDFTHWYSMCIYIYTCAVFHDTIDVHVI